MADLATLQVEIKSDGVVAAKGRLDSLTESGQKASNATDRLRRDFGGADTAADKLKGSIQGLSGVLATLGVALTAAFAFKTLSDFEQSMATVRAITRATGAEYDALRQKAQALGAATRYTAGEAADAMRYLAQAGFGTNEVLAASADVLALAQAGNLGLADAAEIAAKALRGFRLEADEMGRVADLMAKAFTHSNTTVRELGEAFTYAAPVAASLGVSIEDTTAAISALSDAGISASMAGTALRGIMMRLSAPTKKMQDDLAAAGLSMDSLNIKSKGLIPVLETLARADLGEAGFAIFGQRAGPAFEVLSSAIPKLKTLQEAFKDASGYAIETARIMDDNVQGAFKNLVSAIENFILRGSDSTKITILLKDGMLGLADIIRSITEIGISGWFLGAAGAAAGYVLAVKAVAIWTGASSSALGLFVLNLRTMPASMVAAITPTTILTGAVSALGTALRAFAANPIVLALTALGLGVGFVINKFIEQRAETQKLDAAWEQLSGRTKELKEDMTALGKAASSSVALDEANLGLEKATISYRNLLDSFQQMESIDPMSGILVSVGGVEQVIEKFGGSWNNANRGIKDAAAAVEAYIAVLKDAEATDEHRATAMAEAHRKIVNLMKEYNAVVGDDSALDRALKAVQRLSAAYGLMVGAGQSVKALATSTNEFADMTEKAAQKFAKLMGAINLLKKGPIIFTDEQKSTANEALSFLDKFTEGTIGAKKAQWELQQQSAATAMQILEEELANKERMIELAHVTSGATEAFVYMGLVGSAALQKLELDAETLRNTLAEFRQLIPQVKMPTEKGGGSGARYQEAAQTKIVELQLKEKQTRLELLGLGKNEVALLQIQMDRNKELSELRDKAAKAGIKDGDKQLQQAQDLVNSIYDQKEAWQTAVAPLEQQVALMEALGDTAGKTAAEYQILALRMKMIQEAIDKRGPGAKATEEETRAVQILQANMDRLAWSTRFAVDESNEFIKKSEEKQRQIEQENRHFEYNLMLEKARADIYNNTKGAGDQLRATQEALNKELELGNISLEYYNVQMVDLQNKWLDFQASMGEMSFLETMGAGLFSVTEGWRGAAMELKQIWGDFFKSFSQGVANSIGQAIIYGKDLKTALGDVARTILSQLISALVQFGIQLMLTKLLGDTLAKTSAATSVSTAVATGAALEVAYLPAAIAASIATFGAAATTGAAAYTTASAAIIGVSKIAGAAGGFKTGGYTGDLPADQIAGWVHGGEYVMPKETVDRWGIGAMDAIRAGVSPTIGQADFYGATAAQSAMQQNGQQQVIAPQLQVIIENYGTDKEFEVEQMDEGRVRVIARDEARAVVREDAPGVIAGDLRQPNGETSKALAQSTKTARRYT